MAAQRRGTPEGFESLQCSVAAFFWASMQWHTSFRWGKRDCSGWILLFKLASISKVQILFQLEQNQILKHILFSKTLMFRRHSYTKPALIASEIH